MTTTIETPKANEAFSVSKALMVSGGKVQDGRARYGKANVLPENVGFAEALSLVGMDYEVEKRPMYIDGREQAVPGFNAVVRTDTDDVLSVVQNRYRPVNNADAFGIADSWLGEGEAKAVAGGSLQNGKRAWMILQVGEEIIGAGDAILPYLLLTNGHDGNSSIQMAMMPERFACTNALTFSIGRSPRRVAIRHTGATEVKLGEARRVLGLAKDYLGEFGPLADRLALQPVSDRQVKRWTTEIWPDEEGAGDRAARNREEAREIVRQMTREATTNEGHHGTAWAYVNSVAEYADWGRNLREAQISRMVYGDDDGLKNKALKQALAARTN